MNVKSQWSVSLDACRWFWVGGMKLARVWTKSPRGKFLRYLPKVKTSLHANHLLRCSACFREVFSMPQINNMEFPLCMFHKFFGFFFCCCCCLVTFLSKSTAICVLFSSPSFPFRKKKKKEQQRSCLHSELSASSMTSWDKEASCWFWIQIEIWDDLPE